MSMFGFNVNKFIAEIGKSGVAYRDRYEVMFGSFRNGGIIFNRDIQEKMNTRLESVTLPAGSIGSNAVKLQGIDREMPYGRIYEGDIKLIFLEDRFYDIRKQFEAWQARVIDENTFQCGYYDEYTCNSMDITVFNQKNQEVYLVRAFDLFPKTINEVELNSKGEDFVKTEVNLSFRRWISDPNTFDI